MLSESDRYIALAIKPEIKRLKLDKMQTIAVFESIRENPHKFDDCLQLLKETAIGVDNEKLVSKIIDVCFSNEIGE